MIVTTYCTAQSLILQLISSDELLQLVLLCVITVTTGGPIFQSSVVIVGVEYQESMIMNNIKLFSLLQIYLIS